MNVWTKSVRAGVASIGLAMGLLSATPMTASAAVFYPSGSATGANDLNDLDHDYYYAWGISGTAKSSDTMQTLGQLKAEGITSVSITFKDLYNWNSAANVLHMDLLDTMKSTGNSSVTGTNGAVRYAADYASQNPTKQSEMTMDAFDSSNALVAAGTAITQLTDRSFVAEGVNPTSTSTLLNALVGLTDDIAPVGQNTAARTAWANGFIAPPGWTFSANPTGGWDYTYTFTDAQESAFISYINGSTGYDIGLAFDPDCHFYNDGVYLTVLTGGTVTGQAAVPEPATLLMLGTGLLTAARYRRRKSN